MMPRSHPRSFADLIRHGKNHSARQHDDAAPYAQPHYQPTAATAQQQRQRDAAAHQPQPQQQHHQQHHQQPKDTNKFKEEIETIVKEEREAKGKMPTYKGLENYQLLDKMGE